MHGNQFCPAHHMYPNAEETTRAPLRTCYQQFQTLLGDNEPVDAECATLIRLLYDVSSFYRATYHAYQCAVRIRTRTSSNQQVTVQQADRNSE